MLTKNDLQLISQLLDQKLDEKLDPIKQRLFSIEQDIKWIKEQIKQIRKANNEDIFAVTAVTKDMEKLEKELLRLKKQVKILAR